MTQEMWFLFCYVGYTDLGAGTWFTNKGVTVRNIWRLWLLIPSEIWLFYFVKFLHGIIKAEKDQ